MSNDKNEKDQQQDLQNAQNPKNPFKEKVADTGQESREEEADKEQQLKEAMTERD